MSADSGGEERIAHPSIYMPTFNNISRALEQSITLRKMETHETVQIQKIAIDRCQAQWAEVTRKWKAKVVSENSWSIGSARRDSPPTLSAYPTRLDVLDFIIDHDHYTKKTGKFGSSPAADVNSQWLTSILEQYTPTMTLQEAMEWNTEEFKRIVLPIVMPKTELGLLGWIRVTPLSRRDMVVREFCSYINTILEILPFLTYAVRDRTLAEIVAQTAKATFPILRYSIVSHSGMTTQAILAEITKASIVSQTYYKKLRYFEANGVTSAAVLKLDGRMTSTEGFQHKQQRYQGQRQATPTETAAMADEMESEEPVSETTSTSIMDRKMEVQQQKELVDGVATTITTVNVPWEHTNRRLNTVPAMLVTNEESDNGENSINITIHEGSSRTHSTLHSKLLSQTPDGDTRLNPSSIRIQDEEQPQLLSTLITQTRDQKKTDTQSMLKAKNSKNNKSPTTRRTQPNDAQFETSPDRSNYYNNYSSDKNNRQEARSGYHGNRYRLIIITGETETFVNEIGLDIHYHEDEGGGRWNTAIIEAG